tara:strand:- start:2202 stop:3107 length:906 start_codon:yes stop_codon:yes gene_type:complete
MNQNLNSILVVGSTGLVSGETMKLLCKSVPGKSLIISATRGFKKEEIKINHKTIRNIRGFDATNPYNWEEIIKLYKPSTIAIISNCRHFLALHKVISKEEYINYSPRVILVGTTGVYSPTQKYSNLYKEIESLFFSSNLYNPVLIRPSLIYGDKNDQNMNKVISFIKKYKFWPLLCNGRGDFQPVYYKNVSEIINKAILMTDKCGAYNVTGKTCINYIDMASCIFKSLDIPIRLIRIPDIISYIIAYIMEFFMKNNSPISVEQINRLIENKCFDHSMSIKDFEYSPLSFEEGIKLQVKSSI